MWPFWFVFGRIARWIAERLGETPSPYFDCPWCGHSFDWYHSPWFVCTRSGVSAPPGDYTVHWFEGKQTCPRCRHKWFVADSG